MSELQTLPTGAKFYPVEDQRYQKLFEVMLSTKGVESLRAAQSLLKGITVNVENYRVYQATDGWKLEDTSVEFPIINMGPNALYYLNAYLNPTVATAKADYAYSHKIAALKLPLDGGYKHSMRIQYDSVRKGIIRYDTLYNGELVNNKPMVVNKLLKEKIVTSIREIAVMALIDSDNMEIPSGCYYMSSVEKGEILVEILPRLYAGTYDTKDLIKASLAAGIYGMKYDNTQRAHVLDITSAGVADFKINSNARTKLIYMYGGYKLPENYQEWFDG